MHWWMELKKLWTFIFSAALVACAQAQDLKITWEPPTKHEDGELLDQATITGYDLYQKVDGGERVYTAWVPEGNEYVVDVEKGEACFQLVTVTKDAGKSEPSEWVCHTIETEVVPPPVTGKPCAPGDIKVEAML